jgi:hypothetical protein
MFHDTSTTYWLAKERQKQLLMEVDNLQLAKQASQQPRRLQNVTRLPKYVTFIKEIFHA